MREYYPQLIQMIGVFMVEAQHNDFPAWQEHCRNVSGSPKPSFDALRIAVPEFYESLADLSKKFGAPLDGISTDTGALAETRIPYTQAVKAILSAANVANAKSQQEYLAVAKKWLETPHPLQGERTRAAVGALLDNVLACIKDPSKLHVLASQLKKGE